MRDLVADLGREVAKRIQVPADAEAVMSEFCRVMSERRGWRVDMHIRDFPPGLPISGLRLLMADRTMIVLPAGMNPQAQLVILGHELYHEEHNHCTHSVGLGAAARGAVDGSEESIRRVAELVMSSDEVPPEALIAVAARSVADEESDRTTVDQKAEVDAETFGYWFASAVRKWVRGRHEQPQATAATVEGRLTLSLSHRGGRVL
ncbi:toxin [Streptomyces sp. VN1]|uniref:toxin n=1 Tax=Streptomyces sp. VN1 TaxID=1821625 RepID=UPI001413BDD7|nr:toxin [Streptomyces sp. VN1]QIP74628.1 toxin [Streptomyces sp. VN1]